MTLNWILYFILVNIVQLQVTQRRQWFHQVRQKPLQTSPNLKENISSRRNRNGITPLNLVLLPPRFKTQRCLDGSPFGYFIRRSKSKTNSQKWILFLMGGGACVTPMDCIKRKTSPRGWGSSRVWNSTFLELPVRGIIPYCEALSRFAAHIQQVDMEVCYVVLSFAYVRKGTFQN